MHRPLKEKQPHSFEAILALTLCRGQSGIFTWEPFVTFLVTMIQNWNRIRNSEFPSLRVLGVSWLRVSVLHVCVLVSECLCTCDLLRFAYLSTHLKTAHPEEFYEVTGWNIDARKEINFFFTTAGRWSQIWAKKGKQEMKERRGKDQEISLWLAEISTNKYSGFSL